MRAGSPLLLLMIIAIRAWPNSHSNINTRFVLMVFVAHFIRFLRTLTQMALVCKTVPGERDKVRSTVLLTTYQLNYLHWKISHGSLENLTATSAEKKKKQIYASPSTGHARLAHNIWVCVCVNKIPQQSSDRQLSHKHVPVSHSINA